MKSAYIGLGWLSLVVTAQAQSGQWVIKDKVDPLDDTRSYSALILSDDKIPGRSGQLMYASLGFACDSRAFFATISWPDLVDDQYITRSAPVRWRLDNGQPQSSSWLATVGGVTQLGKQGLSTLQAWSTGHKLIVEVPDHHGGQEVTFNLDGIAAVYQTLSQRNCGPQ